MPPLPTTFPESSPQMLHDAPSTNLVTGFFQKYEFQNYKHDPDAPLEQEFNRLSIARKWGVAKRKTKKELFDKAVKEQKEKNSTNKLEAYFKEKEFVNYKYNPNEAPEIEFTRLCKARQWGRYRVKEERKLFNELVKEPKRVADAGSPSQGGAKTFPSKGTQNDGNKLTVNSPKAQPRLEDIGTARFFKNEASKSTCGYKFLGRSRQEELKDLIGLMKSGYENEKIKDRDDTASEHGPENEVRKGFYMAVEEEFNWVLKNLIMRGPERVKKLKPWEYLVELFGVGKAPISREGAEKVGFAVPHLRRRG